MKHLDLFSGIGGFTYAVDQVWDDVEHIFCEINPYCRALLKRRFPGATIFGDIRELTAYAERNRCDREKISNEWEKQVSMPSGWALLAVVIVGSAIAWLIQWTMS